MKNPKQKNKKPQTQNVQLRYFKTSTLAKKPANQANKQKTPRQK